MAGIYWLGTALACGLTSRRLTGSNLLGATATVLTFVILNRMNNEPGHPGGLLALITAWAVFAGVASLLSGQRGCFFGWQGLAGAALFWTKINVGVFHLIASVSFWPVGPVRGLSATTVALLRAGLALVCSTALMLRLITDPSTQVQWLLFAVMTVGLVLTWPGPDPSKTSSRWRLWLPFVAGGLLVTIVSVGGALAGGTRLPDLFEGSLLGPLRHPGVYTFLSTWHPITMPVATASLALAVGFRFGPQSIAQRCLYAGKLLALLLLLVGVWQLGARGVERACYQWLPLLGWAMAVPTNRSDNAICSARHWLAWALCWHWLQAYPVAGTQTAWGSFLAVPLFVVAINDLLPTNHRRVLRLLTLAGALAVCGRLLFDNHQKTRNYVHLDLPGARSLRLDPRQVSDYRLIVANARANGKMLFTFPGMLSFNTWSELPPPTAANTTHWFSLLSPERQNAIQDALKPENLPMLLIDKWHLGYLLDKGFPPHGPLVNYLGTYFEPALLIADLELWKPRGNPFSPTSSAMIILNGGEARLALLTRSIGEPVALSFRILAENDNETARWERTDAWQRIQLPDTLRSPAKPEEGPAVLWLVPLPDGFEPFERLVDIIPEGPDGQALDHIRFLQNKTANPAFTYEPPARSD